MRIGYARVSTRDQHPEAQHERPHHRAGCERVFIGNASGKLTRRPELVKALLVARSRLKSGLHPLARVEASN